MRIIPAIDVIDGKCVRLTQGDYDQKKIYNEDPLTVAREFEAAGLKHLHLVDLDGAKAGKVVHWEVVKNIVSNTTLAVDFGGGIKTAEEIEKLFTLGVKQVNLGSIAVKEPATVHGWIQKFGAAKIILSADVKNERVAISGWQENSEILLIDFIHGFREKGIEYVTCTDIHTDGMLSGPNTGLYQKILHHFPALKLIASGGVSEANDLKSLKRTGVDGVIIGKAIYEKRITLAELVES